MSVVFTDFEKSNSHLCNVACTVIETNKLSVLKQCRKRINKSTRHISPIYDSNVSLYFLHEKNERTRQEHAPFLNSFHLLNLLLKVYNFGINKGIHYKHMMLEVKVKSRIKSGDNSCPSNFLRSPYCPCFRSRGAKAYLSTCLEVIL